MGLTHDLYVARLEAEETARKLLVEVGYLKSCPYHNEIYGDSWDDEALTRTYKIANARITKREIALPLGFSRRDFTDTIKGQAH